MNDVVVLIDEIDGLFKSEQWQKCINLCRKVLPLTRRSEHDTWFRSRFILSKCLILNIDRRPEDIDESIDLLNELLSNIVKEDNPIRWAIVNLGLGYAYDERKGGDRKDCIELVIKHYKDALSVFTKDSQPEEWAATMAGIGYAYGARKIGDVRENASIGIKYIENSLKHYTKTENSCQYWDKLKEIKRLGMILHDHPQWDSILTGEFFTKEINQDLKSI